MAHYRKKPVVIEAIQFDGSAESALEIGLWTDGTVRVVGQDMPTGRVNALHVQTLEGNMYADVGDWVIKGVKGEFYPCKPDIFEATYEPA